MHGHFLLVHIWFTPSVKPKSYVNWFLFKNSDHGSWTRKKGHLPWVWLHGPRCTSPRIFNVEPCQQCIIDRLSHKSFIDKWFSEHHSRATLQRCWVHGMSGKKPSNHVSTLITFTIYSTRNVFFSPPHACVGYGSRITRLGFLCPPKYFVCMYFVRLYEESL